MIEKNRPLFTEDSKLSAIPRWWLKYVEPRIKRTGTCWHWQGAVDTNGEPVMKLLNPESGKYGTQLLKRVVAGLFYKIKKHYDVFHECGELTCLNPSHLYVSASHWSQEDREDMVNKKRKNIADYLAKKGLQEPEA